MHVPSVGWRYDKAARGGDPALRPARMQNAALSSAGAAEDDPMTLFIDGPAVLRTSGIAASGWTYIGRLVDDSL